MMGIRLLCFVITVVAFVNHAGWLTLLPAAGAIGLPYFAVVVANSRHPSVSSGFQPYEPRWPARYQPPPEGPAGGSPGDAPGGGPGGPADGASGDPSGSSGAEHGQ